MKGRKLLSFALALALCVGLAVSTSATSDVWAPDAKAVESANRLYELGLFSGVGNNADGTPNFDLARMLNRQEAVTMLVRLLGKEGEALAGSQTHTFTDVVDWAQPYVAYAQINGLTSGTSASTFGGTDNVTATQYLTFILRALGYSSGSDFEWNAAWELTDELEITNGEYGDGSVLVRGEAVLISAKALDVKMKDGSKTLLESIGADTTVEAAPASFTAYGYMVIEDNTLRFDEVEIVEGDDLERMAELGLSNTGPMYFIHPLNKGIVEYELTDTTEYNFTDFGLLFVEDENGDRQYSTTDKEEFLHYLNTTYVDSPPAQTVPYLVQVQDGKVISVTEEFRFTV